MWPLLIQRGSRIQRENTVALPDDTVVKMSLKLTLSYDEDGKYEAFWRKTNTEASIWWIQSSLTWSTVRRSASTTLSALAPRFSEEGTCRSLVPELTPSISPPTRPWTFGVVKCSTELVKHCYPSLRSTGGTPPANNGLVRRKREREKGQRVTDK